MGRLERPGIASDAEQPTADRTVTVLYFAAVREQIGLGKETVRPRQP